MATTSLPLAGGRDDVPFGPKVYGGLYDLIGRFLLHEIDTEALDVLRAPEVAALLGALEPSFPGYVERSWTAVDFDEAAAEYCALFVLPGGVTPYASYWIPGSTEEIGHQLVAGVDQVLDGFGLSIERQPMGNVPKDHISLLLTLAGYLYLLDEADAHRFGHEFVANFIRPFASAFAGALLARTDNPVYRALAHLLTELTASRDLGADQPSTG